MRLRFPRMPTFSLRRIISWLENVPSRIVGPKQGAFPFKHTVVWTVVCFLIFVVFMVIAALFPTKPMRYVFPAVSLFMAVLILLMIRSDFSSKGAGTSRGRYRRNLGNTVFCVLFTLIAISFLYYFIWHEALNHDEIHLSQDSIDRTYFPSVALFQRVDWTSQAVLNTTQATSKCYLGWYDNDAPHCADVPPGVLPCNCGSNWIPSVVEDFLWQNITYRYLVMVSSESLTCLSTSTEMLLQAFYWFNASQAWLDSSWHLNPSLWLSIWDPTLTLQEALEKGYTRLVLINANGMSSITLGLRSRQAIGGAPAYDYQLSVSTTPAQDLVCDVSGTIGSPSGPCHITLLLQFPTFERQISRLMPVMGWVDVISSAGSFYAVVQLLSWIVSGMVFAT